jgi:hypothetical protein
MGPDFICIGAQKGGTQWLYDQLANHPQFWMPPIKELHYFDLRVSAEPGADRLPHSGLRAAKTLRHRIRTVGIDRLNEIRRNQNRQPLAQRDLDFLSSYLKIWTTGENGIESYARLFCHKGNEKSGDITPGYSILDGPRVEEIAQAFAALKVIYLARDPVDRLWSAFSMAGRRRSDSAPAATVDAVLGFARQTDVIARSMPSTTVARWSRKIPRERLGVFFFDDLKSKPATLREDIFRFLDADQGAPQAAILPNFNRKKRASRHAMPKEVRDALVVFFADEIRTCAKLLGGAAVSWPTRYAL